MLQTTLYFSTQSLLSPVHLRHFSGRLVWLACLVLTATGPDLRGAQGARAPGPPPTEGPPPNLSFYF